MNIVESLGAIHTHANHDAVALEALRPLIVDQRGIGLHVLFDRHTLLLECPRVFLEATGRFVVEPTGKGGGVLRHARGSTVEAPNRGSRRSG